MKKIKIPAQRLGRHVQLHEIGFIGKRKIPGEMTLLQLNGTSDLLSALRYIPQYKLHRRLAAERNRSTCDLEIKGAVVMTDYGYLKTRAPSQ
ncbi:hypothetical protein D3C73_1434120 [compost metagenome]